MSAARQAQGSEPAACLGESRKVQGEAARPLGPRRADSGARAKAAIKARPTSQKANSALAEEPQRMLGVYLAFLRRGDANDRGGLEALSPFDGGA